MANLRLAEAQQLNDALSDPLLRPALEAFLQGQRESDLGMLLMAVRQSQRDTMREAFLAGRVDAYETLLSDLEKFAEHARKVAQG